MATSAPEADRAALFAEGERDARETAARVAALEAAAGKGEVAAAAAETRAAELRAKVNGPGQSARRERDAFERRQREREWDLRALAPAVLVAFADALSAHADGLAMDRLDAVPGRSRGETAQRCRQLGRELREDIAVLPSAELAAALARVRAEVALMVPQWQARFLLPFLTDATEGEDV